jgi:hypothetical protein
LPRIVRASVLAFSACRVTSAQHRPYNRQTTEVKVQNFTSPQYRLYGSSHQWIGASDISRGNQHVPRRFPSRKRHLRIYYPRDSAFKLLTRRHTSRFVDRAAVFSARRCGLGQLAAERAGYEPTHRS